MVIGDKQTFAIECYHDPTTKNYKYIFGRICIFVSGIPLGDIHETTCILDVIKEHLLEINGRLESLNDKKLQQLSDRDLFNFLNKALYIDDDRTLEEVRDDAEKYFKYDFLTNAVESFDGTKSFMASDGANIRLMFTDTEGYFHSSHFPKDLFLRVTTSFIQWIKDEKLKAG